MIRRLYARYLIAIRHAHYAGIVPNLPGMIVGYLLAYFLIVNLAPHLEKAVEQGVRQACSEARR